MLRILVPKSIDPTSRTLSYFNKHLLDLFSCLYVAGTPPLRYSVTQILQSHGRPLGKSDDDEDQQEDLADTIPNMLLRTLAKLMIRPIPSDSVTLGGVYVTLSSMSVGEAERRFSFLMSTLSHETTSLSKQYLEWKSVGSSSVTPPPSSLFSYLLSAASVSYCCSTLLLHSLRSDGEPQNSHVGSRCRGCLMDPIVGVRYRCISRVRHAFSFRYSPMFNFKNLFSISDISF